MLCHDVSENALGRAYILARVLQRKYDVVIAGPRFYKNRVWPPCDTGEVTIHSLRGVRYPAWIAQRQHLRDMIKESDIVYAIKARPVSLGLGIWAHAHLGCSLIVDIDDWEVGGYLDYPFWRRWLLVLNLSNPNGYTFTRQIEHQVHRAEAITTVSSFLQRRYGGIIIPHGRDAVLFDPARYNPAEVRRRFDLPQDKRLLLFLGTPRRHKGLGTLFEAHRLILARPYLRDVHIVIGGIDWTHPLAKRIREWSSDLSVTLLGIQPFTEIPALLAAADIVVVPQAPRPFSQAQIPAKLIDAMAMSKPIAASAVSDVPIILDNCGLTVPPGDAQALADAIERLLVDPQLAKELGQNARQRFLEQYTCDAMAARLLPLVDSLA
jgi:glycosyltransferase involved in cell wall biosynthesis